MNIKVWMIAVLIAMVLPLITWAEDAAFVCRLKSGKTVPIVLSDKLANVAVARRTKQGKRVIVANPTLMALFQPATRWFWLAHECAHQQLGHTLGHYGRDVEQQADCYGIRQLIKSHHIALGDLPTIQKDIEKVGGDGKTYLPGPQRAYQITACALTK